MTSPAPEALNIGPSLSLLPLRPTRIIVLPDPPQLLEAPAAPTPPPHSDSHEPIPTPMPTFSPAHETHTLSPAPQAQPQPGVFAAEHADPPQLSRSPELAQPADDSTDAPLPSDIHDSLAGFNPQDFLDSPVDSSRVGDNGETDEDAPHGTHGMQGRGGQDTSSSDEPAIPALSDPIPSSTPPGVPIPAAPASSPPSTTNDATMPLSALTPAAAARPTRPFQPQPDDARAHMSDFGLEDSSTAKKPSPMRRDETFDPAPAIDLSGFDPSKYLQDDIPLAPVRNSDDQFNDADSPTSGDSEVANDLSSPVLDQSAERTAQSSDRDGREGMRMLRELSTLRDI